jgi:hypothetical protein
MVSTCRLVGYYICCEASREGSPGALVMGGNGEGALDQLYFAS